MSQPATKTVSTDADLTYLLKWGISEVGKAQAGPLSPIPTS